MIIVFLILFNEHNFLSLLDCESESRLQRPQRRRCSPEIATVSRCYISKFIQLAETLNGTVVPTFQFCHQLTAFESSMRCKNSDYKRDPETAVTFTGGHFNQVVFAVNLVTCSIALLLGVGGGCLGLPGDKAIQDVSL